MKIYLYIAHPYSDDPEKRLKQVDKICKKIRKEEEVIPISPLHLFSFIEEENEIRDDILSFCKQLIMDVYTHNVDAGYKGAVARFYTYGELSGGQKAEYELCFRHKFKMEFRQVD